MANRRDFFFKQKVTEAEMDEAFNDLEVAERNIILDLGFLGVITNGVVTENTPTQDLQVIATGPMRGRTSLGERLSFGSDLTVDLSKDGNVPEGSGGIGDGVTTAVGSGGNEKWVSLFMIADRNLSDPRIDGLGATVFYDRLESFHFVIVQSAEAAAPIGIGAAPATPAGTIRLADVRFDFGKTQIFNADIDITNRDNIVFTGASKISVVDNFTNISGVGQVQETLEALDGIVINKDGSVAFTGNQAMGGFKLTGLDIATAGTDAVRKTELDLKANNADVIKKNGSVAFTANQSMGNNKLTSVAAGTAAGDAIRKDQLDTKAEDADVIKKNGSVAFTANQSMANNKLISVGVPTIDSTDAARKVDFQNIALGSVQNLAITTSVGSPFTDVTVTADAAVLVDANGNSVRRTGISKTLALDGSGVDGLDTGSEASSTWYFIWLIFNGTTVSTLFSLSATAPTLPSGYTFKYLVGARFNDGGSNLIAGIQKGSVFLRDQQDVIRSATVSVAGTFEDVDLSGNVPPISNIGIVQIAGAAGSAGQETVSWRRKGASGVGHDTVDVGFGATLERVWTQNWVSLDSSQEFQVTATATDVTIIVNATGFVFPLE